MVPDTEMLVPEGGCSMNHDHCGSTRRVLPASHTALLISDDLFPVHILILSFQRHSQGLPRLQRVPGSPCRSLRESEFEPTSI